MGWAGFELNENRPERHLRVGKIFYITIINEPFNPNLTICKTLHGHPRGGELRYEKAAEVYNDHG